MLIAQIRSYKQQISDMEYRKPILIIVLFLFWSGLFSQQQPEKSLHYRAGDWVTYSDFRQITSVAIGNQYIYFGTYSGIIRYNFFTNKWAEPLTVSDGLPSGAVRCVAYDKSTGFLWCSAGRSLCYYLPAALEWRVFNIHDYEISYISKLGVGDKNVWAKGPDGVYSVDSFGNGITTSQNNLAEKDNVKWMPSLGDRRKNDWPQYFMQDGYRFFRNGIIQDRYFREFPVTVWLSDSFGTLWFGTMGLGSGKIDTRSDNAEILRFGLFQKNVSFIEWAGDGMWIGGRSADRKESGITYWNMETEEWVYFEPDYIQGLQSCNVNAVSSGEKYVWFGTDNGLVRYNTVKDVWRTFHVNDGLWDELVLSLIQDGRYLWIGTDAGLNRVDLLSGYMEKVKTKELTHRRIFCLEVTGKTLWAGSDRGIFSFDIEHGTWMYRSGASDMPVMDVYAVSSWENEIWFGTDYGVEVYNSDTDKWRSFLPAHYPTGSKINTILADSAFVWFGTDNGILKYIKNEERWFRYTVKDGLISNKVNWILLDGDYVWAATSKGLTRFLWNAPYRID